MNRHTFADVAAGKRNSLANDLDVDNDAEDEGEGAPIIKRMRSAVEGEEEGSRRVREDDGEECEAFNLKEEREGELGHFDETGNYVFKKGAGGGRFSWLHTIHNNTNLQKRSLQVVAHIHCFAAGAN